MFNYKFTFLFFFVTIFRNFKFFSAESHDIKSQLLPFNSDVNYYLEVVEKISQYCFQNKEEIDLHLAFGIFVTNVNIIRTVKDKNDTIPRDIRTNMNNILITNEESLQYFKQRSTNDTEFLSREFKQISKLFSNASYWVDRLKNYVYKKEKSYSKRELENMYLEWDEYVRRLGQLELWIPTPSFSDMCLVSLAINPVNKKPSLSWCPVKSSCYIMLKEGTNFGYALSHRQILLLMAHLGRGCYILSEREDKIMREKYCSMAYAEAEYIAMHNYGNADLLLEIMFLCSLDGHTQFLRRKWLQNLLSYQLPQGCFRKQHPSTSEPHILYMDSNEWKEKSFQKYDCNSHTTAVAHGTYSSAVRLIIQEYY